MSDFIMPNANPFFNIADSLLTYMANMIPTIHNVRDEDIFLLSVIL